VTAKSILRRAGAIVVALLPIALHVASAMSSRRSALVLVGEAFAMIALTLGALDFYVSFIRRKTPRVSPAPLVGTLLVVVAGVLAFGDRATAIFALVAYMIDTGGPPWFIAATWRDRSMWG
jgi:hypothetical protein